MKLGYWKTEGGHALRTHILHGLVAGREAVLDLPICGHVHFNWVSGTSQEHVLFPGKLQQVECLRCLRVHRKRLRRQLKATQRRLDGKDGVQVDAWE